MLANVALEGIAGRQEGKNRQACKVGITRQEGSQYHGVRQEGKVHRQAKAGREKEAYMQKEVGRQKQAKQAGRKRDQQGTRGSRARKMGAGNRMERNPTRMQEKACR
jgi:hypothetical protein